MLRVSAFLVTALLGLSVTAPAVAAEKPVPPLCATAASLTAEALPRQATDLLATQPGTLCLQQSAAAQEATDTAQSLAGQAVILAAASSTPDWAIVEDLLARAEALDSAVGTGPDDTPNLAQITATKAAAAEATGTVAPPRFSGSWVAEAKSTWSKLADSYLSDLGTLVLVVIATMGLAVALGRLLVLLPITSSWDLFGRSSRGARRWVTLAAWGTALLAGLYAALVLPDDVGSTWVDGWALARFVGLLAGAALLMWWTLATRMRISISVSGKEDGAGASEIIALLRELGAEGPAGLEIPRGTDVDVLAGKNIVEKPTGWMATALSLVQQVLGFTPWRVVIDENETDDETYVIVTRNGRSHGSALISGTPWGDQGPAVDRTRMAAAFVLVSLAEGYAASDFAGLAGATSWRSVGLTYVATSTRGLESGKKKFLLLRAIDYDPANKLAQLALKHEQHRMTQDVAELEAYRRWLTETAQTFDDLRALQLRTRYTALAVSINRDALNTWEGRTTWTSVPPSATTIEAAQLLKESLEACCDLQLARSMAAAATPLLVHTHVWLPSTFARIQTTPTRTYNEVGIAALTTDPTDPPTRGPGQIAELATVTALDGEIDEAWADPTFAYLRALPEWTQRLGRPARGITEVEPFARYAEALDALGLETVEKLRDTLLTEGELAHALGIRTVACRRLMAAVHMVDQLGVDSLKATRVEIFSALWDLGIHDIEELRHDRRDSATLAESVIAAVRDGRRMTPDRLALEEWILLMRAAPVILAQGASLS